mgnify:CR=1 FL=1
MQPLHVLQQRSWLLHWSLFLFWSPDVPNRHDQLIEMFTQPSYGRARTKGCGSDAAADAQS